MNGSVTSSAAAGAPDPCALITKAEVEAAFGETMLAPVASVDHGDATCTYSHKAGGGDLIVTISSQPNTAAGIKALEGQFGKSNIPGISDAAFKVAGILEFVKGTTLVTVGSGDGPAIISDDHLRGLAKTAAGRV